MKKATFAIATFAMVCIASVCSAGYIETGTFTRHGAIGPGGNFSFSCPGGGQCYTSDGPNKPKSGETIHILRFWGPRDPNFTDAVLASAPATDQPGEAIVDPNIQPCDGCIGN